MALLDVVPQSDVGDLGHVRGTTTASDGAVKVAAP